MSIILRVNESQSLRAALNNQEADDVLLDRLAIGDQEAFQCLLQRYLPYVLKTAERMVGDAHVAEDIAQDVMIKLWDKASKWDQGGQAKLKTWLYRVTVNQCIDRYRRPAHMQIDQIEFLPSIDKDAISHIHEKQLEDIIRNLFYELTGQQRFVMVLSYYEGLATSEIAQVMELTTGAVSALLHRGRTVLKHKLTELGIEGWADDKIKR